MRLVPLSALALLVSTGYAFAGAGAPVPEGSQAGSPSGRPGAVLGDTLAGDKAVPYVVNFQMVDTDKDGKISASEFKSGCGKGWIQSADASTTKAMTPPAKL